MEKLDFIAKQLSKAANKKYEHYIISRIWHLLNDLELKIITQQHISLLNGKRALTDLFFPQLKLHLEIDEEHHLSQIEQDKTREADIISITGHQIKRIKIINNDGSRKSINEIHSEINSFVETVRNLKKLNKDFKPWDILAEQSPKTYILKKEINLKDDCSFKTMVDAANCFGYSYQPKAIWKGGVKHPHIEGTFIWFPKLYKNDNWDNSILNNDTIIIEKNILSEKRDMHVKKELNSSISKRIVFARVKSPLGDIMYRFKGLYELDKEKSNKNDGLFWKRIATKVETYPQNSCKNNN